MDFNHVRGITGIYSIKTDGRIYVGSAVDMYHRWHTHLSDLRKQKHSNSIMQRIFNKHGECAFTFDIVIECSRQELIETEQGYIDVLRMFYPKDNVLNLSPSAKTTLGRVTSEETKQKISAANKGRKPPPMSPEGMERAKNAFSGRTHTSEARAKISAAHRGRVVSDETRKKMSESNKGRIVSAETRAKIVAANTGRKLTPEHIEKLVSPTYVTDTLLSPDGVLVEFTNVRKFCEDNGLCRRAIYQVRKGLQVSHKGWRKG